MIEKTKPTRSVGWDRCELKASEALAGTASVSLHVDALAQEIRRVDGRHNMGAGALAEALMPFLASHALRMGGKP